MEQYFHNNLLSEAEDLHMLDITTTVENVSLSDETQNQQQQLNQHQQQEQQEQQQQHEQHEHCSFNGYEKEDVNSVPHKILPPFIYSWSDVRPEDVQSLNSYYLSSYSQSQQETYLHNWQRKFQPLQDKARQES